MPEPLPLPVPSSPAAVGRDPDPAGEEAPLPEPWPLPESWPLPELRPLPESLPLPERPSSLGSATLVQDPADHAVDVWEPFSQRSSCCCHQLDDEPPDPRAPDKGGSGSGQSPAPQEW